MGTPASGHPLPAQRTPSEPAVVFTADFTSARQRVAGRSWAYPRGGPVNPGDDKLDHLVSGPSYSRSGVFKATRRPDGDWDTGLLTTEGSEEAFTVRSGDVLEARVRLPREVGAWPAIWTWRDGDQEIDVFETTRTTRTTWSSATTSAAPAPPSVMPPSARGPGSICAPSSGPAPSSGR